MSVINQVLLELEKRRASGAERGTLPDHVRALPESGGAYRAWWIAGGSVAGIALLATIWVAAAGYRLPPHGSSAAPTTVTEAAIERVVAPLAGTPLRAEEGAGNVPAARMSFELSSPPRPEPVAPPDETARPQGPILAARVLARDGADARPGNAPETASAPAAAAPPPAAKDAGRQPAPATAQPPAAAEKSAAAIAAKAEIEKQVRQPTSRELADNEYRKAATLLQQGRLAEAQEGFRAALNLHQAHHGARQALVALVLEGKQRAEAERALQEGLKLAPEQIGFAMTLARLQVDRGDNPGAIATLQSSAGHAQGSPDYLAFLAALLQRQGRHEDAIEQFGAALRGKPSTGVWWLGLGISLQAVNRPAEAQDAYRRAKGSNLNPELAAFADQRLRQLQ